MFYYAAGAVLCAAGIYRIAMHVWIGANLSRGGNPSRGLTVMRIGVLQGTGLVLIGVQLILIGYWGDYRSLVTLVAGTILLTIGLILHLF